MVEEDKLVKCYSCHKPLLHEKVINGVFEKVLSPESDMVQFYLNNNSKMDVRICRDCKEMDLNNPIMHNKIINNIIDGWQKEQDILVSRKMKTKEQAETSMEYHRGIKIKFKCDGLNDYQIKEKSKCP